MIDVVSDTLLATKTAGDGAMQVKTKKIEMVLQRGNPADMGKEGLEGDGGGVKFPGSSALFGKGGGNQTHVDTQVRQTQKRINKKYKFTIITCSKMYNCSEC